MPSFLSNLFSKPSETKEEIEAEEEWLILPELSPIPIKETVEIERQKKDEWVIKHFGIAFVAKGYDVE